MAIAVTQATNDISRVEEIFYNSILNAVSFDPSVGIQQIGGTRDIFSMWEFTSSGIVQSYATAPAEAGNGAFTDVEFTIDKKSINVPVPYDLFKNTVWKETVANIHSMGIPAELQAVMIEQFTADAMSTVESEIWTSNGGATGDLSGTINGFLKVINDKLTAASLTAQILTGANSFTDPATIQAQLTAMVNVAPVALVNDQMGAKFCVSPSTAWAYTRSLQLQGAAVIPSETTNFGGFDLQVIPNLNSRWMLLGKPSNLGIGTPSALSDVISLAVNDQTPNNKNQANIFGNFGYGAGAVTTDWVSNENTTA
tara:strand:- start:1581 stop:2513 length:933 start_codon:yes stop_codon:yes gene_type:complete